MPAPETATSGSAQGAGRAVQPTGPEEMVRATRSGLLNRWRRARWPLADLPKPVQTLIFSGLACLIALAVGLTGILNPLERTFQNGVWTIGRQPASGQVHVVEIDAHSIAEIDRWPWPRSEHARIVDQLTKAGARSIIFDVDFSSRSALSDDQKFAQSIANAKGRVVLPTFGQRAGGQRREQVDALPLKQFRQASALASVSVLPDVDGHVRRVPMGTMTAGVPRPSISALLAGRAGSVDKSFPVDFSIDLRTVPRHSFVDIRDGRFRSTDLAGKDVLIGAAAIELGDQYPVPLYGVVPGVYIHALGIETLTAGFPVELGWLPAVGIGTLLGAAILFWRDAPYFRRRSYAIALSLPLLAAVTQLFTDFSMSIMPGFAAILTAMAVAMTLRYLDLVSFRRNYDVHSGLPNQLALLARLESGQARAVVAARITDFDKIVVGLGQSGMAELIRRLRDRIELTTGQGSVHRIEDRVLAWPVPETLDVQTSIATLRTVMLNPAEVNGRPIDVLLAFGMAECDPATPGEAVIANAALSADRALNEGSAWRVHDRRDEELVDRDLSLLGEMDLAIARNEIDVCFQPKVRLSTGKLCGVEALVRWNHPERGMIPPDEFVQLAERSDRIAGLTLYVLRRTIDAIKTWSREGYDIGGAVNISAKLLGSNDFMTDLSGLLSASGIDPKSLTFEITETATILSHAAASAALQSVRETGISVSIDDYGTGQSTLSYIKRLPINELKIDQSFVKHAHENQNDAILVRSTVELAHNLGLTVVAEGVETAECAAFLTSIGADVAQGYWFSKPVTAAEISKILRSEVAVAA